MNENKDGWLDLNDNSTAIRHEYIAVVDDEEPKKPPTYCESLAACYKFVLDNDDRATKRAAAAMCKTWLQLREATIDLRSRDRFFMKRHLVAYLHER